MPEVLKGGCWAKKPGGKNNSFFFLLFSFLYCQAVINKDGVFSYDHTLGIPSYSSSLLDHRPHFHST